jgi:serine/threonine protein kinase
MLLSVTIPELITLAKQVCSAMEYLEGNKVVHRDLAARNILVADGPLAKVHKFSSTYRAQCGRWLISVCRVS